ncbi:MAG: signal peptidase I [Planctomycetota bacterium]
MSLGWHGVPSLPRTSASLLSPSFGPLGSRFHGPAMRTFIKASSKESAISSRTPLSAFTLPLNEPSWQREHVSVPESSDRRAQRVRRWLAAAFVGALLLLLAHALIFEPLRVVGNSMDPTLKEQDRVLVLKVVDARRGELVVFKNPLDPAQNVIKRVVAVAGDKVAIREGRLFVNGLEIRESYLVHPSDHDAALDFPETSVGSGNIFVLGDNRIVSQDSRRPFGPIDAKNVVGRAVLALWPMRLL